MTGRKRKAEGRRCTGDQHTPSVSPVRFHAQTSLVSLAKDLKDEEFVRECCHCGTEIEFETDRCPICGTRLGSPDSGIVEFFKGAEFAEDRQEALACPTCGEPSLTTEDVCSACGERLSGPDDEQAARMDPIIHTDKVVFLHLDVSSGELEYLRRLENTHGFGQATVQISTADEETNDRHGVR